MPILHRVREYGKRRGVRVREHLRGSGSKVKSFSGKFVSAASLKAKKAGEAARQRVREKVKAEQEKRRERKQYAAEAEAAERKKLEEEKKTEERRHIRAEARRRVREGGFLRRTLRSTLASRRSKRRR